MQTHSQALLLIGALLVVAIPAARLSNWLRIPHVTGYLAAGVGLGALGLVGDKTRSLLDAMITLTACYIVFYVGSRVKPSTLRASHIRAPLSSS